MRSRCFSPGGVTGGAGTTSEPLIDHPMPSTERPNGAAAIAAPGTEAPAIAGEAPTGTWKTTHGIAAAISRTAECVANRGAAYFRKVPLFSPPQLQADAAYTGPTVSSDDGLHRRDEVYKTV